MGTGEELPGPCFKINKECKTSGKNRNKVLVDAFSYARDKNKQVHFLGLMSNGGWQTNKHLYSLCDINKKIMVLKMFSFMHSATASTDPKSGLGYMRSLIE